MHLKVSSYNIRKAVGLDWRRRPERVLKVLIEIDADIIALQDLLVKLIVVDTAIASTGSRRTVLALHSIAHLPRLSQINVAHSDDATIFATQQGPHVTAADQAVADQCDVQPIARKLAGLRSHDTRERKTGGGERGRFEEPAAGQSWV